MFFDVIMRTSRWGGVREEAFATPVPKRDLRALTGRILPRRAPSRGAPRHEHLTCAQMSHARRRARFTVPSAALGAAPRVQMRATMKIVLALVARAVQCGAATLFCFGRSAGAAPDEEPPMTRANIVAKPLCGAIRRPERIGRVLPASNGI